ncbi:MAG: dihydropyrimidinase [Gaiellaceae bacterium]
MSTLIAGGLLVTACDAYPADVLIEDGKVALIGRTLDVAATRVIDARGMYVLPGGVDPHTHIEGGVVGARVRDDFTSGTTSAAFGGTTTLVNFCFQEHGQSFADTLAVWHGKLEQAPPVVDVGFHVAVVDTSVGGMDELVTNGVTSFKLFLAYKGRMMVDDSTAFETMRTASTSGALVMVHAENGGAIEVLIDEARSDERIEPIWHARTRPPGLEAEATERAVQLAKLAGCPLYVVHVSCEEALEPVRRARDAGQTVWAETCTHYLFVDETALERPDFEGGKFVYTPPPRERHHQEHLWRALVSDTLSVVSTDHVPYNWRVQKARGREDFSKIPNGAPGVENRLHMLHHFGVGGGRISLCRLVELTATNPAKLFGLYPRKGTIAPGSDADIVVFDPERPHTISAETHHTGSDYNLFEGTKVKGAPAFVLLRGQIVVEDGELRADPGCGRFVHRARFGETLPARV